MNNKYVHRDVKCADDVAAMIALGKFEKEFIAYGTAIQNADGVIYYYASSNEENLRRHVQSERWKENYFTPVLSVIKRSLVPSGMEDEISQLVKQATLMEMKQAYESVDYFSRMEPFFRTEANDNGYPLLLEYKNEIEGNFEDRELQLFLSAVQIAYEGKVLTARRYQELLQWYHYTRRQMEDDPIVAENIERTFYGFVYYENGKRKVAYDAQELCVIHQHYEKLTCGYTVGPIMHKTYWFQQFKYMQEVRESFCNWLRESQNEDYFAFLYRIRTVPGVIDKDKLQKEKDCMAVSQKAYDACHYYDSIWNKL